MNTVLTFDDQGQDFLRWTLNERGIVVKCEPFQGPIWRGFRVLDFQNLTEGSMVFIKKNDEIRTIKYPLISVQKEVLNG